MNQKSGRTCAPLAPPVPAPMHVLVVLLHVLLLLLHVLVDSAIHVLVDSTTTCTTTCTSSTTTYTKCTCKYINGIIHVKLKCLHSKVKGVTFIIYEYRHYSIIM